MVSSINWGEDSSQFHRAKYAEERELMMNGFYPRQFLNDGSNDVDEFEDVKEEEENYGFLFYGYHQ